MRAGFRAPFSHAASSCAAPSRAFVFVRFLAAPTISSSKVVSCRRHEAATLWRAPTRPAEARPEWHSANQVREVPRAVPRHCPTRPRSRRPSAAGTWQTIAIAAPRNPTRALLATRSIASWYVLTRPSAELGNEPSSSIFASCASADMARSIRARPSLPPFFSPVRASRLASCSMARSGTRPAVSSSAMARRQACCADSKFWGPSSPYKSPRANCTSGRSCQAGGAPRNSESAWAAVLRCSWAGSCLCASRKPANRSVSPSICRWPARRCARSTTTLGRIRLGWSGAARARKTKERCRRFALASSPGIW